MNEQENAREMMRDDKIQKKCYMYNLKNAKIDEGENPREMMTKCKKV
jgi:hypothetical protein